MSHLKTAGSCYLITSWTHQ